MILSLRWSLMLITTSVLVGILSFHESFQKLKSPILSPREGTFYSKGIYNPTITTVGVGGVGGDTEYMYVLFFRGQDQDDSEVTGKIGRAVSSDMISWKVDRDPVIVPSEEYDLGGCEDPRVTKLKNGSCVMTFVCNDGKYNSSHLCLAISSDKLLENWEKKGVLLKTDQTWDSGNRKAGQIVEIGKNEYVMFFLGEKIPWHTCVGVARSSDLLNWIEDDSNPLFCSRNGDFFDSLGVEPGTFFVEENNEIILFYNGWNENKVHCTGYVRLDEKGKTIKHRSEKPLIYPTLDWEIHGITPNVTFSTGILNHEGKIVLFYGAADTSTGLARNYAKSHEPHESFGKA